MNKFILDNAKMARRILKLVSVHLARQVLIFCMHLHPYNLVQNVRYLQIASEVKIMDLNLDIGESQSILCNSFLASILMLVRGVYKEINLIRWGNVMYYIKAYYVHNV